MNRVVTARQAQRLDNIAIKSNGIPGLILMERAGCSVANEIINYGLYLKRKGKRANVACFCGKGNNGGDGMVCARYLQWEGVHVKVCIIGEKSSLKHDAAIQLAILEYMRMPIYEIIDRQNLRQLKTMLNANIIVDAIFGIGFSGRPSGIYQDAIDFINRQSAYIVSIDSPSGLDATTGRASGCCIKAGTTITIGFAKKGFYKNDGPRYTGKIKVVDIGLSKEGGGDGKYKGNKT
jgi:NAD(P)H-hydrate epimerase